MKKKEIEFVPKVVQKRRRRRLALLSTFISMVGIMALSIIAFSLIHVDAFTITTDNDPQLCLTIDENKTTTVTKLKAPPLYDVSDAQYSDIPVDIEEGLGDKNTSDYFAYSFYLGGVSDIVTNINYSLSMTLDLSSNSLEDATRVMIIRNGERKIYSKASEDGSGKPIYDGVDRNEPDTVLGTTIPFKDNKHIILEPYAISPGDYDRYTVVMWIDGWESVDSMQGGTFLATLKFSTISMITSQGEN